MKANYHTHLALCGHAEGMCEDYVKIATISLKVDFFINQKLKSPKKEKKLCICITIYLKWRRKRDSNPRETSIPCRFSRPIPSAGLGYFSVLNYI